jgi:hypothetical protein
MLMCQKLLDGDPLQYSPTQKEEGGGNRFCFCKACHYGIQFTFGLFLFKKKNYIYINSYLVSINRC